MGIGLIQTDKAEAAGNAAVRWRVRAESFRLEMAKKCAHVIGLSQDFDMQRQRATAIAIEQRRVAQTRVIAAAMLLLPAALLLLLISPW